MFCLSSRVLERHHSAVQHCKFSSYSSGTVPLPTLRFDGASLHLILIATGDCIHCPNTAQIAYGFAAKYAHAGYEIRNYTTKKPKFSVLR